MNLTVAEGGTGGTEGADDDAKVIVRSNGTVTYVGKDIAYQLWKFGLLGRDFAYRRFYRVSEMGTSFGPARPTEARAMLPRLDTPRTCST